MRYMGSKYRLRKEIGKIINDLRKEDQFYWEPFVGSAWVASEIKEGNILCSDINPYLIKMWRALLEGWKPPKYISKEEYYDIKEHKDENPKLTAFVGFGCSWGGKWFGGYAKDGDRNFADEARTSLFGKLEKFPKPITFFVQDFLSASVPIHTLHGTLIYCDPPYKATTGYDATKNWDTNKFWDQVRKFAVEGNTILISEYEAPEDFNCIKEFDLNMRLNTDNMKTKTEKIFVKR